MKPQRPKVPDGWEQELSEQAATAIQRLPRGGTSKRSVVVLGIRPSDAQGAAPYPMIMRIA